MQKQGWHMLIHKCSVSNAAHFMGLSAVGKEQDWNAILPWTQDTALAVLGDGGTLDLDAFF